jgi:hypothetical protein
MPQPQIGENTALGFRGKEELYKLQLLVILSFYLLLNLPVEWKKI